MIDRVEVFGPHTVDVVLDDSVTIELYRSAERNGELRLSGLRIEGRAYRTAGNIPYGPFSIAVEKEVEKTLKAQEAR